MAALPALIASATIVYTTIFPNYIKSKEDAIVASTTSMSTSPSLGSFLMGFSVGISISWMIGYEAKRRRLWETVRFKILSWVYDNTSILHDGSSSPQQHSTLRLADKFRTPALLASLEGVPISPSDVETGNQHGGETLDVLSAHWTVSSGLHVNVLSLSSGSELIPHPANGMEFFFIIKGNGKFHRDGDVFEVIAGYGWISDPGRYVKSDLRVRKGATFLLIPVFCTIFVTGVCLYLLQHTWVYGRWKEWPCDTSSHRYSHHTL
jgi:mannose-6-phosphate isomerase-like protein (cupin superfamily)